MNKIEIDIVHNENSYTCIIIFYENFIQKTIIELYESNYNILLSKLIYELSIKENSND